MKTIYATLCLAMFMRTALLAPQGFVFPDDSRRQKKLEPIITPPILPVLEHLERDPSTLLPHETGRNAAGAVKPRFGFGGGFSVAPSGNGGLTASASHSSSFGGASQAASQSFSFGLNDGFSGSHSASQSASFNGFGSGFGGSQASSQAASFGGAGNSLSGSSAASSASSGNGGSQSASQAFGFNSNGFVKPHATFGDGLLDIRHRGVPDFPFPNFPSFPNLIGRSKGVGTAAFRSSGPVNEDGKDFFAVLYSDD